MKNLFQQIDCKEQTPNGSDWYNTDKGLLFWFTKEQGWSCRDDEISSEYPKYWYSPVKVGESEKCMCGCERFFVPIK